MWSLVGLADTGKGTVAKRRDLRLVGAFRLADTGKGTVAKPWDSDPYSFQGLADTGKGTVAKPIRQQMCKVTVLPTLEKELWQSEAREWT